MLHDITSKFSDLPRGVRRIILAVVLFIDANYLGALNGYGSLNIVDSILGDNLPNDMIWLIQLIQSITAGFIVIKVLFDDVPSSPLRMLSLLLSPFFMVAVTFYSLDLLFQGLDTSAGFTLDLVSITTGTLTWSSTYLAIAIGLTLTYKVQRYGNFAQSELFMIGMYLSMIMVWSDYFFPMTSLDTTKDGVLTWSVLIFTLLAAFILTGFAGIIIDRLVYKGFRKTQARPHVMMIASLGVALILRALTYMRFGSGRNMFEPEGDWRMPNLRWELPTTKFRFNLGDRSLDEGRTYTQWTCEETVDETTGETVLTRIVSDTSKPALEIYDTTADCVTQATTNYAYYKGAVPGVIFSAVLLLMFLLNKTRLGRRMRAVADNPELAASSGINVERVHMTSAFLSAGISGMGGAIFAMTLRFNPETAFTLLLPSFAIIVLGTIGSIPGAIVGSLVVGFVRALSSPVLIGIGFPLGRSNYSALDGVMPYIFLVAVLMIMPEGIGNAYEKWKIDRLRKRKEYDPEKSDKVTAALAILPTGIFGLHHWWRNRVDKMQNFSAFAIAAYAFHRFSDFVGRNSFSNGCGDVCQDDEIIDSNLAVLTGRNDGTLLLEDSPLDESDLLGQMSPPEGLTPVQTDDWTANALEDMNESWLNQMNLEIDLVNFIVDLGDILWPWAFILLWTYSIYEGISILQGKYDTQGSQNITEKMNQAISSISIKINKIQTQILLHWSEFDRKHDKFVKQVRERISQSSNGITTKVGTEAGKVYSNVLDKLPFGSDKDKQNLRTYGRESPIGSWILFGLLMFILILFLAWLPIAESDDFRFKKMLQVSNVLLTLSIFVLMAFSLNLHTGYTGMLNFGVIFFVGIGAITVGILTAPKELYGYDWNIAYALLLAIILAAVIGWGLAYPTARLRTDYFAIVTISLGEILRVLLAGEPLLRVGAIGNAIGISAYPLPLENWWFCGSQTPGPGTDWASPDACRDDTNLTDTPAYLIGDWLEIGQPAPYMFLLMLMSIMAVIFVWILLNRILSSPWGRVLKAIREDEEVAQHHGHDVLTHKAASLALGASIAALAGAFWAWKLTGFQPSFMTPAKSTFLVWAAYIIGGASNNRGMIVGAFIIVLMEFVFNVLVAGQGSADLPLHTTAARIDSLFEWLILSPWEVVSVFLVAAFIGFAIRSERILETGLAGVAIFSFTAVALGQRSIDESFFGGVVSADMLYFKLFLIGCLMLFSLKFNTKGLLPEVPVRPERPNGGESVE